MRPVQLLPAVLALTLLAACSSGGDPAAVPGPPAGVGGPATAAPASGVVAYVDDGATNLRSDPCHVTLETNAGARVLGGFLDVWTPSTLLVDAGVKLEAANGCAAVQPSPWSGLPGGAGDGQVKSAAVHAANLAYVEARTAARTGAEELAAYLDDRRQKGYSVTDGLGPLTAAWRAGARQTTTLTAIPADAATTLANDGGNNLGVGSAAGNADLGLAVDLVAALGGDGSTEPAKRFYKYPRPYRWSAAVAVAPSLLLAESKTPETDGGFPSGHAAEGWRDALGLAYLVPERFQELLTRATELGENRIVAGMHSPLDVMGGRILATAVAAYNLNKASSTSRAAARAQALAWLQAQAGASSPAELLARAHGQGLGQDRFASRAANREAYRFRLTYGLAPIAPVGAAAVVPKGAEVLLETRLPYLTAEQRRVVLRSTALPSGSPLLDDAEGWGRLDLFAAGDGYGAFEGDVAVTMDAAAGGFAAEDTWRNDIGGPGKLVKRGTGTLHLAGANTYAGGTELEAGVLAADGPSALGDGDVYVHGGTLRAGAGLAIAGQLTLLAGGTLELAVTSSGQGPVTVAGGAFLEGGTLHVTFPGAYRPAAGDRVWVLVAGARQGKLGAVTVDGYTQVKPEYAADGLRLLLLAR